MKSLYVITAVHYGSLVVGRGANVLPDTLALIVKLVSINVIKFFLKTVTSLYNSVSVFCTDTGEEVEQTPLNIDMAFVVEITQNSMHALRDLVNHIGVIVRDAAMHHPEWIANFLYAYYDSNGRHSRILHE